MMKTKPFHSCLLLLSALLACGVSASCTGEDDAGWLQEEPSGGKYPLQIAGASIIPASRASDGTETWTDGSEIGARMGTDGNIGKYKLNADGSVETTLVTAYGPKDASVTAWYPYTEINDKDISNQSSGYSGYDFLKAEATGVSYGSGVSLAFNHLMSKVKVTLKQPDDPLMLLDLTKAVVKFRGNTRCTYKEGTLTSASQGYITAFRNIDGSYEALLPPETIGSSEQFIRIEIGNTTFYSSLKSDVTLSAGNVYSYAVTLNDITVDLTQLSESSYTVIENCILDGKSTEVKDKSITVNDGVIVVLKNIKLTGNTHIRCPGSATIILKGTNEMTCSGGFGLYTEGGTDKTLTITGTDSDQLTISTTQTGGTICAINNGNITINGGHIIATNNSEGGAIGCAKIYGGSSLCNKITINGGIIEANGGTFGSAIGGANWATCGDILITGGSIKAKGGSGGAGIGAGQTSVYGNCGAITITGGIINATGGGNKAVSIGHGNGTHSGNISITGGTITVPNRSSIDTGSSATVTIGEGATMNYTDP